MFPSFLFVALIFFLVACIFLAKLMNERRRECDCVAAWKVQPENQIQHSTVKLVFLLRGSYEMMIIIMRIKFKKSDYTRPVCETRCGEIFLILGWEEVRRWCRNDYERKWKENKQRKYMWSGLLYRIYDCLVFLKPLHIFCQGRRRRRR